MKKTELQETIDNLNKTVANLVAANSEFIKKSNEKIEKLEKQVEVKYLPCNLEQEVLRVAQTSISEAIKSTLTGYSSPLNKFVTQEVDENNTFLKTLISDSFSQVIRKEEFKQAIVNAFSHKVARTIVSNNDGLFERVSQELKQDSVFKAKMALAVSNIVEECLREKKTS